MSYLGRGTDKISNIEVLDNITFDGSSSYSITKSSVAFTPNSAQSLLISIDGVVQATNFTVSGSTIDFGVAIPSTSTCDFFLHYGTGLITVPADGTVSLDKLSATGTKDATTFLRGDNTFAAAGLNGWSEDGANNNLLPANASAGIYLGVNSATAANLLDDYEEGTWSPAIGGTTIQTGYYTKVGRMVIATFGDATNSAVALTNGSDYTITGLPFSQIGSGWQFASTPTISYADASGGYKSFPLTGRQDNGGNIHVANRSGQDVSAVDPLNLCIVYQTN